MRYLDLTLASPLENLALDEALLADAEAGSGPETLRVWESPTPFVVLGLGGNIEEDVYVEQCGADEIPILRRSSGGGTVLQGPGSLSYAVVLRIDRHPALQGIVTTNRYVLERVLEAVRPFAAEAEYRGISDLSVGGLKISGNAQRRKREWLLFHGTLLHGFDPRMVERYLRIPKRQPDYRENRPHASFLRNLAAHPSDLKAALRKAWGARHEHTDWPRERLAAITEEIRTR
jgi:lipoate-protein ligase A